MARINSLLVLFLFYYVHLGYCQNNNIVSGGMLFEDFQKDLKELNKYVTYLFEDSKGFIWMGTYYGVHVFDGSNFSFYKDHLGNNYGFKGNRVRHISETKNGKILVGMNSSGINVFNPATGQFKNYNDSIFKGTTSNIIKNISESNNRELLITTDSEVIVVKFDSNENLIQKAVFKVKLNKQERLRGGVFYNDQFLIFSNKRVLLLNETETRTIFEGQKVSFCKVRFGALWMLADKNIGRIDIDNNSINWLNFEWPKEEVWEEDFEFASQNLLFLGTKKGCLQIDLNSDYKVLKCTKLRIVNSNLVARIYSDKNNNLYFGVAGKDGGIKKLNINHLNYKYIGIPSSEKEHLLNVFLNDSKEIYWSGGNNGVFAFNSKTDSFKEFSNASNIGLKNSGISDILEANGVIWFKINKGIAKYVEQQNNFEIFDNLKGNNSNPLNKLYKNDNNLWFSTRTGVAKFDTYSNKATYFDIGEPSAISINNNILWVNIQKKGLFSYDISSGSPKLIDSYEEDFSMLSTLSLYSPVRAINFDHFNRLWLSGTSGIYVYDYKNRKIIRHINKSNILNLDALYDLLKDERGNFWVKQFNTPAICIDAYSFEIIEKTPSWMYLPTKVGRSEFNSGPTYQDKFKQIFINGTNGYIVYHPDKLEIDKTPPRVVLTDIDINGASKYSNFIGSQDLEIPELKHDENSILLNIKSISHDNSPLKKFAYRLKGVSDEWKYTNSLEPLNYIGLKPNTYALEVKSTNNGQLWSPVVTLTTFDILPPWWKTTLAYIIYLILFTTIIYAFYKIQLNKKLAVSEANQLKQIDDFKNKFYQNITHEFRTPLTVIIGMVESLESKASKMVKRNAQQLLSLVNELLEIGKIESNSTNLELSTKDIVVFTKYCMESLESLVKNKEINLRFNSNPNSILIDFDIDKMQLVLNNLLSNAIKFTPKNGLIEVSVKALEQVIEIKVKDSGRGVSEDNLEKIFDRYFQEKNNKSVNGTGLGLALSRELVKLMNGTIKATNNKDRGACFTVTLPIKSNDIKFEDHQPKIVNYDIDTTIGNEEDIILVIEDNQDVLTYISSLLEPFYKVYTAPNGKLGFEKAVELIPDLIISDVMMPIMDGYQACHLIKSDFRTDHIPVIMLTAKVDHDSKISGLKIGADVYLGKPFNSEELLTHINNLISTRENLKKKYSEGNDHIVQAHKISNEFLDKITKTLLNNLSDDTFGINEICKELGVSRTQLHRKLKALTGLSTSIFIREARLNEGYKLIKNSELSISEIAYSIGFSDPNYFTKLFTEKFQVPPSKIDK